MNFAYYPGCSASSSSMDYERSTRAVCRALNIGLLEITDWNCCGSTPAHVIDEELSTALCVRNLDLAAKMSAETIITSCPSCLSNLRHAAKVMKEPEVRERVNGLLDNPAAEDFPEVTSVMQGIASCCDVNTIQQYVCKPLKGIKIATYYGCLMSRPAELMQFGDPENPTLMDSLLAACGAEVVDFPLKTECCGASFGIPERPMTAKNSARILEVASNMGVDAIAVACPFCQMNLDLRQKQASKESQIFFRMPILYYTQLMGIAFGIAPQELGLEKLCVSADGILQKVERLHTEAQMKAHEEGGKA